MAAPSSPLMVGRYELLRKLSAGGMAEIYLARTVGPGGFEKTVVLKRVLPNLAEDPSFVAMFLGEARLVARFNHPNVVQVFDFGEQDGTYFLVMEFIDGLNLRQLLRRLAETREVLPLPLACRLASMACEGLAYAHDFIDPQSGAPLGLVHRDISPENLLVSRDGVVKVVDFGIARAADLTSYTKTGQVRGKFAYMAPEQLLGEKLDRRVDVFAMGVVLFELLTGQRPWKADTEGSVVRAVLYEASPVPSRDRPDVPPALDEIVLWALAKKADERYPDCRAIQADLTAWLVATHGAMDPRDVARLVQRFLPAPAPSGPVVTPRPSGPFATPQALVPRTPPPLPVQTSDLVPGVDHLSPPAPPSDATGLLAKPPSAQGAGAITTPGTPPAGALPSDATRVLRRPALRLLVGGALIGLSLMLVAGRLSRTGQAAPAGSESSSAIGVGAADLLAHDAATPRAGVAAAPPAPGEAASVGGVAAAEPLVHEAAAPAAGVAAAVPHGGPAAPATAPVRPAADPPATPGFAPPPPATGPSASGHGPAPAPPGRAPKPASRASKSKFPVEFRVRPFATVYVDGALVGDTPLDPIELTQGTHLARLVNRDLDAEITLTVQVGPGQNIVRHNFRK